MEIVLDILEEDLFFESTRKLFKKTADKYNAMISNVQKNYSLIIPTMINHESNISSPERVIKDIMSIFNNEGLNVLVVYK